MKEVTMEKIREMTGAPSGSALSLENCWMEHMDLRGLNLRVPRGSLFAILGGNGTGKSTALKAVCGSVKAYRGSI